MQIFQCKNLTDMIATDPHYDPSQTKFLTPEEIDEFLRDIKVQNYVIKQNIY